MEYVASQMNLERVQRAETMLRAYRAAREDLKNLTNPQDIEESTHEMVVDLLADLMHYMAHRHERDEDEFAELVFSARGHFQGERDGTE